MKKTLFIFDVQSKSDVITNSSSELFVFVDASSLEDVKNLLDNIYPDWSYEYEDPKYLKDATDDEIDTYLSYRFEDWSIYNYHGQDRIDHEKAFYKKTVEKYGISYEEAIREEHTKFGNNEYYVYFYYTDKFIDTIREKEGNKILLFSIGENPDWDHQETLMEYAERYHLG